MSLGGIGVKSLVAVMVALGSLAVSCAGHGLTGGRERWNDVPTHIGTMSRDITQCPRQESNLRHPV